MLNADGKKMVYFNIFKDMIEVFGDQECGSSKVDVIKLANYLSSDKFFVDTFSYSTEEDIQEYITNQILNGFPVWEYLVLTDWQRNMLEKSFSSEVRKEYEEAKKKYKCLSCKYYKVIDVSIGYYEECKNKQLNHINRFKRDWFKLRKSCKYFELNN